MTDTHDLRADESRRELNAPQSMTEQFEEMKAGLPAANVAILESHAGAIFKMYQGNSHGKAVLVFIAYKVLSLMEQDKL